MNTFDPKEQSSRGDKTICLLFENEADYAIYIADDENYRSYIDEMLSQCPELFPPQMVDGYGFYGSYYSTKQKLKIRRIELKSNEEVYQIRPSFVMPYMTARTDEVEKALYLSKWVPLDALVYAFGRDEMYWYRMELRFGRPSIVGTTVKDVKKMPENIVADEKHTRIRGEKAYAATTVAEGCFLGVDISAGVSTEDLQKGYGEFASEAREHIPDYSPQTVCTDGWNATDAAWRNLFPTVSVILCFLHAVLKLKDRCRKYKEWIDIVTDKAWNVYTAPTKSEFLKRCSRLRYWAKHKPPYPVCEILLTILSKAKLYAIAYDFKDAHRTSNAIDRLMDYQDRSIYAMKYFHGTYENARLMLRAQAMLWNFHPYCGRLKRSDPERTSPVAELNGFQYHSNWLHNFLISASLNGRRNMKIE